jgi:Xaa-Pro aminopeptidase
MQTFFKPDFFANNRRRLLAALDIDAPVIITGNGQMQHSGDEPVKFHQDSNFWYLTGLNGSDLVLVMYQGMEYVIVPGRSFEREAFDGAHDPAAYAARSGIQRHCGRQNRLGAPKNAFCRAKRPPPFCSARPAIPSVTDLYTLPYRRQLIAKLRRLQPGSGAARCSSNAGHVCAALSSRRSCRRLQRGHRHHRANPAGDHRPGPAAVSTPKAEYELEGAISYGFRRRGAEDHAFTPIVGAGQHTTTLAPYGEQQRHCPGRSDRAGHRRRRGALQRRHHAQCIRTAPSRGAHSRSLPRRGGRAGLRPGPDQAQRPARGLRKSRGGSAWANS